MKGLYNGASMKLRYLFPHKPKQVASLSKDAQKRLSWMDFYERHGSNARLTCRHFGISPDTFYRWKRRFNKYALFSLEDDTSNRRPNKLRDMTTPVSVINRVIAIREKDREKSKYEIQEELRREGVSLGTTTIQKIINRHLHLLNTQHIRKVRAKRKRSIARIKAALELKDKYPGSLVQIDTKHLYVLGKRFYVFAAIDCYSRIGYISAYKTDNGSEYLLHFHQTCINNITHYFTYPRCPKMNGRVERFIQTATYEYFNWQYDLLDDLTMIRERAQIFNDKYNTKRYHQVLQYKTPMEYLQSL